MRAVDTQTYFVACSSATNDEDTSLFQSWGHSGVVDPWGKIISNSEQEETILYANIDLGVVDEVREQILVSKHKRPDIYETISKI